MVIPASIDPTKLSGLGPVPSILLIVLAISGLILIAAVAWFITEESLLGRRYEPEHFQFELGPVDRGTALPCWCNEDGLKGVATQHKVDGTPAKVEKKRGLGLRFGLPLGAKAKADGSTKVTHKPFDDIGVLILQVLARLDEEGELNQGADMVHLDGIQLDPILALSGDQDTAEAFFARWIDKHFPNGLQTSTPEELASKLAEMREEIPEEHLRARLQESHRALAESNGSILLLEGEWRAEGEEGDLRLERTDLRVAAYEESAPKSLPLPTGVAIHVKLDGELTRHGKNSMVGVTRPIRGSVMGTVRQYEPTTGCLEIAPIAVFQRF